MPAMPLYTFFPKKNGNPQSKTFVFVPPRSSNAALVLLLPAKSVFALAILKLTAFDELRSAENCVADKLSVEEGQ